ncbi:MAG: hypothetical protein AAFX78_02480 [Cyanobacteria bacterium J06638_20]
MGKFDHYKVEVTKDTTQQCTLFGIALSEDVDGTAIHPVLTVRPAWDVNTDYANARIKASKGRSRTIQKKGIEARDIRTIRKEDVELYATHIVIGWVHVVDEDGEEVPFTAEDCRDFLASIPEAEFDELRNFCNDYQNWGMDPLDSEGIAGNL